MASLSWRAKKKPFFFPPVTLPASQAAMKITLLQVLMLPYWLRGFAWCSEAALGCQTMALSQPCEAGQAALSLSQWTNFSDIPWGFVCMWSSKSKLLPSVPHCMASFSQRKEIFISCVFYLSQGMLIILFKDPIRPIFFIDIKRVKNKIPWWKWDLQCT